jgi:hypothetical protein
MLKTPTVHLRGDELSRKKIKSKHIIKKPFLNSRGFLFENIPQNI